MQQLQLLTEIKTTALTDFDIVDRVELTESEIRQFKWEKLMRLEQEDKDRRRREFKQETARQWSAKELFDIVSNRLVEYHGFSSVENDGKPIFQFTKHNEFVLQALCRYFTNSPNFEQMQQGWKLKKGICLMGNVGRGKSLMMRLFANNKRRCFNVVSARHVSSEYAIRGHEAIKEFSDTPITGGDYRTFYQTYLGTCFDDVGTEEIKKNFGNELNVMAEIISNRYDGGQYMFGFDSTHITTNLTQDEFGTIYGTRVRSRMRETMNVIVLEGDDLRK